MSRGTITVLPGDGIGPEVTAQALKALQGIERRFGHTFTIHQGLVGSQAIAREGAPISDATFALCAQSDGILFGAVGSPAAADSRPGEPRPEEALFRLRKGFGLFANLRPIRPAECMYGASPLRPEYVKGTDMMFVRELSAGLYYGHLDNVPGKPSKIRRNGERAEAIDTLLYTDQEIERVVRAAFVIARDRQRKVTSVDKANVLSSSLLWREVVERVAGDYPSVAYEHMLVDTCAMNILRSPSEFDVIVTENMFGDILTDEASMLTGSIGMLPSASIGVGRSGSGTFGLYEPIHGTAPEMSGRDLANPIASILSAALLLRHSLGLRREAAAIEEAVRDVLNEGQRTADISTTGCASIGTEEMGQRIFERLLRP
ncbi:3-isopropylmalate dehydrogenase [Streptomyces sp. NPDC059918]|uniref:3-isopropylmalate dehydrogenase n=1 Tax=unclassified Streptomyces TaxID=2593676 RepID=UPI003666FDD5